MLVTVSGHSTTRACFRRGWTPKRARPNATEICDAALIQAGARAKQRAARLSPGLGSGSTLVKHQSNPHCTAILADFADLALHFSLQSAGSHIAVLTAACVHVSLQAPSDGGAAQVASCTHPVERHMWTHDRGRVPLDRKHRNRRKPRMMQSIASVASYCTTLCQ